MATRPFTADDDFRETGTPVEQHQAPFHRYQLNIVASTTADVVRSAGGWVFDRARAGWDVNVLVARPNEPRPLAILGAKATDLDASFPAMVRQLATGGALAVDAGLLVTDVRIRDAVVRLLKRGLTEVTVWGDGWPAELGRQGDPVQHRISAAARAFKSQALAAAAVSDGSVSDAETFFRIGTGAFRPLYSV